MAELTALHLTDIHEDTALIEAAAVIAEEENIDAAYVTGDFIGKNNEGITGDHETLDTLIARNIQELSQKSENLQAVNGILEKYDIKEFHSLEDIPDEKDRLALESSIKGHERELQEAVIQPAAAAYTRLKGPLKKLAEKAKIIGVLGNHDLTLGYDLLSDIIDFAELKPEIKIKGKNGREFAVKGAINSYEVPATYTHPLISRILRPLFINYLEGNPESSDGNIDEKFREAIRKAQEAAAARLNETGPADILLTHVQPRSYMGPHGKAVEEYSRKVSSVYGGHGHGGEIAVYDGKPVFRPGTNHIFVYDYNERKELEAVRIYRIREPSQTVH